MDFSLGNFIFYAEYNITHKIIKHQKYKKMKDD